MSTAEIIYLAIVAVVIGFVIGYWLCCFLWDMRCDHKFEKIIDTPTRGGCGQTVVHMCKKCGKRKITKV